MQETEKKIVTTEKYEKIYLAGGCFWGMEKLFLSIDGVVDVTSGYANGNPGVAPNYEFVCTGMTGYKETVEVIYDSALVSLEKLLLVYYNVIDPTVISQQGPDRGPQYQTGIYHVTDEQRAVIEKVSDEIKKLVPVFMVELEPLKNFFPAEEYHQRYLEKVPHGYCHIPRSIMPSLASMDESELRSRLPEAMSAYTL